MLLRGINLRRSYTKCLLFSIIIICFFAVIKYLHTNSLNNLIENNPNDSNSLNNEFEKYIRRDLAKQIYKLGNDGKAAFLNGAPKEIGEKDLSTLALNNELSEHISYNRTLPDVRNPLCRELQYDLNSLPTTSVIVIFYNEPYSVIIRTIHSVLNTCDQRILKEIILVDDFSSNVELKDKLDYYIATRLPKNKVKVIRLENR